MERSGGRMEGGQRENNTQGTVTVNSSLVIFFCILLSVSIRVCNFLLKVIYQACKDVKLRYMPIMNIMYSCT